MADARTIVSDPPDLNPFADWPHSVLAMPIAALQQLGAKCLQGLLTKAQADADRLEP